MAFKETSLRSAFENPDDGEFPQPVHSSELAVGAASAEASGVASELAVGAASAEASGVASELVVGVASAEASDRAATAGESPRIIGLSERYESDFPSLNSSGCVGVDACARASALPAASASLSSSAFPPASLAVVADARSTPMHGAHNSWSDTARVRGPTGTRRVKGGVSGPPEDLRPVSGVEVGVNFRPAGGVRGQVCRFTSQEATKHRYQAA